MANCRNTQQLNITCGTDVVLHDKLMFDGEVFDPNVSVDIECNLVNSLGKRTSLEYEIADETLIIQIPWVDGRNAGCYGLEVKGKCNGKTWATYADSLIRYTHATVEGAAVVETEHDWYDVTQVVSYRYSDSPLDEVDATIDDNYGEPTVTPTYEHNKLTLDFKNLRGNGIANIEQTFESTEPEGVNETTITQDNGNTTVVRVRNGKSIVGPQGIPGEGAIWTGEGEEIMTLAQETGQAINKGMSQKAVTDELVNNLGNSAPFTKKKYSVLENGKFGSSSVYYHAAVKVAAGERYLITNEQRAASTQSYTTYAYATSDASSAGSSIPLVSGTSVMVCPLRKAVIVTIPTGCTYLLVNYNTTDIEHYIYNVKKLYGRINNLENSVGKIISDGLVFNRTDFISSSIDVGDIGAKAYVSPSGSHAITQNDNYRYFWIKCLSGDVVKTNTKGWTDNVSIGFSQTKDIATMTVLDSTSGTGVRSGVAPSDGYFFIGLLYMENGVVRSNYVWMSPSYQDEIDKIGASLTTDEELELSVDGAAAIANIQAVGTVGNTVAISSATSQTSLIFKVSAKDVIKATVMQYFDTSALSFSEDMPAVGVNVKVLAVGGIHAQTIVSKDVSGEAPSDGYIMLTYLHSYSNGCTNLRIGGTKFTLIEKKVDRLSEESGNIDFRNNIQFMNVPMDSGTSMNNWSGNDVINNIYEPLRAAHPEYITRKSLGKDQTGTYDIWLYEFNNSADELFDINKKTTFSSNVILPSTNGLSSKQCGIKKSTFDAYFDDKTYSGIYFLIDFSVRKLEKWTTMEEDEIGSETYYIFTFSNNVKVVNNAVEVWWTIPVKTYDQHAMIISGVHADEMVGWIGTSLALKHLVEHHDDNPSLDYIFNHVKLSVIPIVNMWGANQSPKSRTDYAGNEVNNWKSTLTHEQSLVAGYIDTIKDDLSFFADYHTSEFWANYGFVYAVPIPHSKIYPAIVSTANYLCKHWFPNMPPYNWNIGGTSATSGSYTSSVKYMYKTFGVPGSTVEFCGFDLEAFGNTSKWSSKYMTYAVENYINFMLALCSTRIKNNSEQIVNNDDFERTVMS